MSLEAVATATLTDAQTSSQALSRQAAAAAQRSIEAAHREAAAILAAELALAERLAARERRAALADARVQARRRILHAQQAVLASVRAAAHAAARSLVRSPGYDALCAELEADARRALAPYGEAEVRRVPGGGLTARAGSAEVDYSLHALVERCLQSMPSELESLWR